MATHRIPILNYSWRPDDSGLVYPEPALLNFGANDRYKHMLIAFTSQTLRQGISGLFSVPKNYVGTPSIVAIWATTATTGDVVWDFDYTAVAIGESLDPSADQEAVTVTDTAAGTARLANEASMALTGGNLAVDDTVLFNFYRDAVVAGDTLAATAYLFGLFLQYADA